MPGPFTPLAVLPPGKSPVTNQAFATRRSTSQEQREEAVRHAAAWMLEKRIFTVQLRVAWTRSEPTDITVAGHLENVGPRPVLVVDRVTEADAAGRSIVLTPSERHAILEQELAEIDSEGL